MTEISDRIKKTLDGPKISISNWRNLIGLFFGWLGAAGLSDNIIEWKEWFEIGIMIHWRYVQGFLIDILLSITSIKFPEWSLDYIILSITFFRITGLYSLLNFYWFHGAALAWSIILFPLQIFTSIFLFIGWPLFLLYLMAKSVGLLIKKRFTEVNKLTRIIVLRTTGFSIYFIIFLFFASDLIKTFSQG